jgi:hypothetical protein
MKWAIKGEAEDDVNHSKIFKPAKNGNKSS